MTTRVRVPASRGISLLLAGLLVAAVLALTGDAGASSQGLPRTQARPASASRSHCAKHEVHRIKGWLHTCDGVIVNAHHHLTRLLSVEMFTLAPGAGDTQPAQCGHWSLPRETTYASI